jgi:hypothetical protein
VTLWEKVRAAAEEERARRMGDDAGGEGGGPGRTRMHFRMPARRTLLIVAAIFVAAIMVPAAVLSTLEPSLDRAWDEDVAVLAGVEFTGDAATGGEGTVRFTNLRDWTYTRDAVLTRDYFDAEYDPADIVGVWLYEQELGLDGLIAHTFLVFEFGDGEARERERFLGLSVETRREQGEEYSLVGGLLRSFEVTHIWATETDLVRRRVEYLDYPLTRYRVDIPADYIARIFTRFARETDELSRTPQWYNTLSTNCTSALIRYVNTAEPGAIPPHYSYVVTGRAAEYLRKLGYLDTDYAVHVTRDYLATHALR